MFAGDARKVTYGIEEIKYPCSSHILRGMVLEMLLRFEL